MVTCNFPHLKVMQQRQIDKYMVSMADDVNVLMNLFNSFIVRIDPTIINLEVHSRLNFYKLKFVHKYFTIMQTSIINGFREVVAELLTEICNLFICRSAVAKYL